MSGSTATAPRTEASQTTGVALRAGAGVVTALIVLLMLGWGARTGMVMSHVVTAILAVLLTQVLPGALVWRVFRPRDGWWAEDLGFGFAIGSVLAALAQVPAGLRDLRWVSAALLLGLAAVLLAVPFTRRRITGARTTPLPAWWGPAVVLPILLAVPQLRDYFHTNPVLWRAGSRTLHVDTPLHLAIAGQLEHRGPTTFPWVQSEELGYHWFSHAWIAQVSATSTAGLDEVLLRFMPLLMPIVVVLAVAVAAVRVTGVAWSGPVASLLTMGCGSMNVLGISMPRLPITPLSPSLGLSVPMLVALVVVLAVRWRREAMSGTWLLVVVLALGAAGTKGSSTPLVVAGLGLAALVMLFVDRRMFVRVVVDGVLVVTGLALAVVFVFRGSGAGLHFSLADAAAQAWPGTWLGTEPILLRTAGSFLVLFTGLTPAFLGLVLLCFPRWRRDPLLWLLTGGALAGVGAIVVFAHPGQSQGYFALSAIPLLALLSTWGLVALATTLPKADLARILLVGGVGGLLVTWVPMILLGPLRPGAVRHAGVLLVLGAVLLVAVGFLGTLAAPRRRGLGVVATIAVAIVVGGLSMNWDAVRRPSPPAPGPVSIDAPLAVSRGQVDAARWIRDHSGADDLVMSNRHCVSPKDPMAGCDSRRMVVAAYSERQMLVEGWTATPRSAEEGPHGHDSITVPYWHPDLLALNDGFIAAPTEASARELRERGVRWIFVDHTRPFASSLAPYAVLRHRFSGVDVWEFAD